MTVNRQVKHADKIIKKYAASVNAFDIRFEENKNHSVWTITLRLIKLEFVYVKKEKADCPVSTLFCRVYPQKNSSLSYHIPELIELLNIEDYRCYYFSYIESAERMDACFDAICCFINTHMEAISSLSLECDKYEKIKLENIKKFFKIKKEDIPEDAEEKEAFFTWFLSSYDWFYIARFTTLRAYQSFLNGHYQKALKQYKKVKGLLPYEEKLLVFIETLDSPYEAISQECESRNEVKKYNASKEDFFTLLLSWLIGVIIGAVPFAIAILIINMYFAGRTLYTDGFNVLDAVLFALLPGILFGTAYKNKLAGFLHKQSKEAKDFNDILMPPSTLNGIKILCAVLSIMAVLFFSVMVKPAILVYDGYFKYADTGKAFPVYESYEFEEVRSIYHINGRYNNDDEYIERDSFIFVMSDGTLIDTDTFNNTADLDKKLVPLFGKNVIDIKSERDIPE